MALHLLKQWKDSGRGGLVFLAGDQDRAERIGNVVHSLDSSADVMVYPRLDSLPFDGLEPSREIAGRRASVLRRLAGTEGPALLITTAEAIMERLPTPEASALRQLLFAPVTQWPLLMVRRAVHGAAAIQMLPP